MADEVFTPHSLQNTDLTSDGITPTPTPLKNLTLQIKETFEFFKQFNEEDLSGFGIRIKRPDGNAEREIDKIYEETIKLHIYRLGALAKDKKLENAKNIRSSIEDINGKIEENIKKAEKDGTPQVLQQMKLCYFRIKESISIAKLLTSEEIFVMHPLAHRSTEFFLSKENFGFLQKGGYPIALNDMGDNTYDRAAPQIFHAFKKIKEDVSKKNQDNSKLRAPSPSTTPTETTTAAVKELTEEHYLS